jgi:AraC-like DNA-binding protein
MAHRNYKVRGTPDCPIAVYSTSKLVRLSHWHPEVELLLVTCGTIHCRLGDRDLPLTTGDILIINPNQAHSFLSFSEDHRYINVFFSTEAIAMPESHIFQRLFVAPLSDGRLQLPNLLQPEHPAYDTVSAMMKQLPQGSIHRDDTKLNRYTRIVAICAALQPHCTLTQASDHRQYPEERTMRIVMNYIHNLYFRPLTLTEIAQQVHLHPNYLSNIFKAQTGHTITEHIAQTRVDAAKFILRRDALPMARVAELSGFPSERAFYRQFKKFAGMTPKEYQIQQTRVDR